MPKSLFYAGIIFTLLLALIVGGQALSDAAADDGVLTAPSSGSMPRSAMLHLIGLLLISIPVAALHLRMASLMAARNLFASLLALFAVVCTALSLGAIIVLRLKTGADELAGHPPRTEASLHLTYELDQIAGILTAFFLSIVFLTLRPYFRLRSPLLALLVLVPAPLFVVVTVQRFLIGASAPLGTLFQLVVAVTFGAVAFHSLRHRHLFLEVTNLRDLLAARPISPREGFLEGDIAFDA